MDAERIRQYREFAAWRQHAANGSVERKCGEIITELCDVADAALPGGYDYLRAQLAAATTETAEQAWEIAKLRYYIEALERLTTPEERQTAADEASIALAKHDPPESNVSFH